MVFPRRADRIKRKTMYHFKDFAPQVVKKSFFKIDYESFEEVLATANAWIRDHKIEVLNIETVVLPDTQGEVGQTRICTILVVVGNSYRYQFVRVWYKK